MSNSRPRVACGFWPTPLHELPRLSDALGGPRIYVKRDDMSGLATGGNKARKLEFLVADALEQGATTLITAGAVQSNHCRQTAAAAARYGLDCILVLSPMAPDEVQGNLLLDRILGAKLRWTGRLPTDVVMAEVAEQERSAGRVPYVIPIGGSNPVGASGYVEAMGELVRQERDMKVQFDHIVLPSGSGGTQAGMIVGARAMHWGGRVLGVSVMAEEDALRETVWGLVQSTTAYLGMRFELDPDAVHVNADYLGGGYGVVGEPEIEAIQLAAHTEGLLVGPVYTGRALAALIDLIRKGEFSRRDKVLFWHTGGQAGIFAHADKLA